MSNDWGTTPEESDLSLKSVPIDWTGFTREDKIQKLTAIIQHQMSKVHRGTFKMVDSSRVAAMALEAQMEMSEFIAEAEAHAARMKQEAEYVEAEKITSIGKEFVSQGKKVSETALKRMATVSEEVKNAKKIMIDANKEYKQWKYVQDILSGAHVFFRNLGKA